MNGLEAISILLLAVSVGCGIEALRLLVNSEQQNPKQTAQEPSSPQAQKRLVPVTVYIPQSLFSHFDAEQRAQNKLEPKISGRKRLVWRVGEHEGDS